MNKFIKLPLFLGITCLVAGGLLAGTVAITTPIIEQARLDRLAKAFKKMYKDETASTVGVLDEEDLGSEFVTEKGILSITKVSHKDKSSIVYQCKSKSAWETLTFYVGFDEGKQVVDGYYCLETSTQSKGYGNFKNNSTVIGKYKDYDGTGSVILTGTTVTSKAVQKAVDTALDDLKTRDFSNAWGE